MDTKTSLSSTETARENEKTGMGFTPGPWEVFGIRARFATISQADSLGRPSRHIAEMAWDNNDEFAPQDARLIAAAPELYEILAEFMCWPSIRNCIGVEFEQKAQAVLAKVRAG